MDKKFKYISAHGGEILKPERNYHSQEERTMKQKNNRNANTDLLQELHHAVQMGLEAIRMVMPKVKDEGLRQAIREQSSSYEAISAKSARLLAQEHQAPKKEGAMEKAGLWTSIQMNTMADDSTQHIAEMMVNGTNMGIVDMTKKLHAVEHCDNATRALAEEYLQSEQQHIETMKHYL